MVTAGKTFAVILVVFALAFTSIAQDTDELTQETNVQVSEQEEQNVEPTGDEVDEPGQDRFIPTEQVSQDIGVSFPSDI